MPALGPHVALSGTVGVGTWIATGQEAALPAALIAGVIPDADHLFDYYLWWIKRERRYLILFLHGWEYLFLGVALYVFVLPEPWLLAAVLGYFTQIGADQVFNQTRWHTYLLTVRAMRGFKAAGSQGENTVRLTGNSVIASLPLGKNHARRWFDARK